MQTTQLHEDAFYEILWDQKTRIIGIKWKQATASMTDDDFKSELVGFAEYVEQQKARGILIDVAAFRHRPGPDLEEWRLKNISGRYYAAGVRRFAFLFPQGASIPPMMNKSAASEKFVTRAFNDTEKAMTWLTEAD